MVSPKVTLVGSSAATEEVRRMVARVAPMPTTVLITGETGTGKEVVARLVHESSPRRDRPFVTINCAAIPDSLLESELFGSERGAFTGAHRSFDGRLTAANGGTVFLDEIGDLSLTAQAKILRALEGREAQRLGGGAVATTFDARFVAATNRDLEKAMRHGVFRSDLYYRISVLRIRLQPLSARREDIPPLFEHFAAAFSRETGLAGPPASAELMKRLEAYSWPGNARELRNLAEWFVIMSQDGTPDLDRMPISGVDAGTPPAPGGREALIRTLESTHWNKAETARRLRWSRMTVYRKIAEYNIVDSEGSEGGSHDARKQAS